MTWNFVLKLNVFPSGSNLQKAIIAITQHELFVSGLRTDMEEKLCAVFSYSYWLLFFKKQLLNFLKIC